MLFRSLAELERELAAQREKLEEVAERDGQSAARVDELADENEAQREKIEQLEARLEEQELAALEAEAGDEEMERLVSLWGFFDLTFNKFWYEKGSPYNAYVSPSSTFMMTNANVYLQSHMTESLKALLEVRLSYLPHGTDEELEYVDVPGSSYERTNTEHYDPFLTVIRRQGGLYIERLHLDWEPVDWFNVTAGRYLTPYGIWNIDHGSPVVLPVRLPYIQIREMVPRAQTGVQVYGRFFPRPDLFFDYAVTLSNGRGPMDEVLDLDENKGVGLRLRLAYEGTDVRAAAGGYGYYGSYTDQKKVVDIDFDETGHLDRSQDQPLTISRVDTARYDEVVVSADLKLEIHGVRLQSEYVWRRVDFDKPHLRDELETLFVGGVPGVDQYYYSSYIGQGVYGLLAYELPLWELIAPVRIIPYVYFEYNVPNDTLEYEGMTYIVGGLNVKPSPYVTLKLEGGYAKPADDLIGKDLKGVSAQMAVSF